ncbi:DUF2989 domain-containing protein [Alteromonas oceanisediminis]|uniref:DUF2989 domain-containing protein n=1 Tax=Alteromonas oceanisediminis TaxID=2836180 RepID=UPI001BDAD473|nr:DUF2989 domain-containing protein [Alteromonas oceanisediminis]MBT0586550.1 DUF2989 domain-containing protein [Alteromonas oceanisediminis]
MRSLRNLSTLIIVLTLLYGCGQFSSKTVATLCEERPDLCSDLNPDAWCRAEKAEIIRHRYQFENSDEDAHKYDQLLNFERYQACVSKAAQIKHIKLRDKEAGRMKGLLTAQRELKRLSAETRLSDNPYLAYYQWSRHGHKDALARFLQHEESGQLETAELQVSLATYWVKRDSAKAINALYSALSLYDKDEVIDTEIFSSLYTLHYERKAYEQAVVWGLVGEKFGDEKLNRAALLQIAETHEISTDWALRRADFLFDKVNDRDFNFES